jgi:hypothetical protein
MKEQHVATFVSYSLDDAKEKILAAREVHEDLPLSVQKRLVVDSRTELAFGSSKGGRKVSRILSHPSKAPRGKKGDIYLDELAHYLDDRMVYKGSTALISRTKSGQVTGCSTPLGKRGIFWEIATEAMRPYPHHLRQNVPWWRCSAYCTDVRTAVRFAPMMPTSERIGQFATPTIVEQYDSLPVEDFQQEYECDYSPGEETFYPYELILPCTHDNVATAEDFYQVPVSNGRLVAGFDVGRKKDLSELAIFDERKGLLTCRMLKSYIGIRFQDQEADLRRMLETLPIHRFSIDSTGIGAHLAENLCVDYPSIVVQEVFTNESKARWATDFKILLQERKVELPKDRRLTAQVHSIERKILPSGKISYDAKRSSTGHADRFWAIALACQRDRQARRRPPELRVRVIGADSES